jgi:MOSC domain-containing protein YiiM
VLSVNVGTIREVPWRGRLVRTGIWKSPVAGPVEVGGVHVGGDVQADLKHHGGPDKAVYSYSHEDLRWWTGELGREMEPGAFGENLTLADFDVSGAEIGERWRVGTVVLEVSQPRSPCFKLGIRQGDQRFVRRFAAADRPGAYLRIVEPGVVAAGDEVTLLERPGHGLTVAEVARIFHRDDHEADRLLELPALAGSWRDWAESRVARA